MKFHLLIWFLLERQRSSRKAVFKHRPSWVLAGLLLIFGFLFSLTSSGQAAMRVVSGKYTGNGSSTRAFTNLGFQPDALLIMFGSAGDNGSDSPVISTSSMGANKAKVLNSSASGLTAGLIKSLDADGFTVGSDRKVNLNSTTYYFVAFLSESGKMKVGSYSGNGSSQNISSLGLNPNYVMVMNGQSTTGAGAVHSLAASGKSHTFSYAYDNSGIGDELLTNGITALGIGQFSVGSNAYVNTSGSTYYYIAFAAIASYETTGSYAGTDDYTRTITVNFQPEFVIVQNGAQSDPGLEACVAAAKTYPENDSIYFDGYGGGTTSAITGFNSTGFVLGAGGCATQVNQSGFNYYWVAFGRQLAPATKLASFSARDVSGAVLLEWQTGNEVDNLGFHIYREENGVRYRVTPEPVAGSALRSGPDNPMRAGPLCQ